MIPAAIASGVLAFQAAEIAAQPLRAAPRLQVAALLRQGYALLLAVDAALLAAGSPLAGAEPSGHPSAILAVVGALTTAAEDQRTLSDMRGYLGRAVLNLTQAAA